MSPIRHGTHESNRNSETRGAGEHQGAAMKKGWQTKTLGEVCQLRSADTSEAPTLRSLVRSASLDVQDISIGESL